MHASTKVNLHVKDQIKMNFPTIKKIFVNFECIFQEIRSNTKSCLRYCFMKQEDISFCNITLS